MKKYLDPKSDIVFKKIFCEHPELLTSFLNGLLPLPADGQIVSLVYLHPEHAPIIPEFKRTIVDVKCTDQNGRIFVVEMQMSWTSGFMQRLLYGSAQAYVKQLNAGDIFSKLNPVYGLGILGESFDKETAQWYHHYALSDVQNLNKTLRYLSLVFVELPKFPIKTPNEKKLRTLWLRFLREVGNPEFETINQELFEVKEIASAIQLSEESAYSASELDLNESFWKAVSSEKTLAFEAEARGEARGEVRGKELGKEIGKIEGIREKQMSIGKAMKIKGLSREIISDLTGLTVDEVEGL